MLGTLGEHDSPPPLGRATVSVPAQRCAQRLQGSGAVGSLGVPRWLIYEARLRRLVACPSPRKESLCRPLKGTTVEEEELRRAQFRGVMGSNGLKQLNFRN